MGLHACGDRWGYVFVHVFSSMMPVAYPAQPPRPLEPSRELIRYRHYSLKIKKANVYRAPLLRPLEEALRSNATFARDGRERGSAVSVDIGQ